MQSGLKSADEIGRQCALERLEILDTDPEPEFEKITSLVKSVFDVPIAAVSMIDRDRQWFKSIQGLDVTQTPRGIAFCDHTIRSTECLVVSDATQDPRFAENPLVIGPPYIRAYMGVPLITPDGYAIGSLCAIDRKPREFTPDRRLILASFADLVMNELELRQVASCDGLTRLANRLSFDRELTRVFQKFPEAALVMLDLDRFKAINDSYGHRAGDEVIKAVAGILRERCPEAGCTARLGGEEFAVLLPGHDAGSAMLLAQSIREAIEHARLSRYPQITFTASLGVATRAGHIDPDRWMVAADGALYAAKAAGRNRVCDALGLAERA